MYNNNTEQMTNNQHIYSLKCGRPKNPCKICFQSVNKKTGVQCRGACKKWAHFNCLQYTPGKIQDIKAGLITVLCPCPDCSPEPKEVITNQPVSCCEPDCPSNNFPKCESKECPKNNGVSTYSSTYPCECVNPTVSLISENSDYRSKVFEIVCPPVKEKSKEKKKIVKEIRVDTVKTKSCACSLEGSPDFPGPKSSPKSPKKPPSPPCEIKQLSCKSNCKPVATCKPVISCKPVITCKPVGRKPVSCKPVSCKPASCQPVMSCKPVSCQPLEVTEDSSSESASSTKTHDCSASMVNALEQMCQTVTNLSEQIKLVMCKFTK